MKSETYLQYNLRGDEEATTRDGKGYWVVVEPTSVSDESNRLFTEVTFITGTAIAMQFGDRFQDLNDYLSDLTFSKAKARLVLGLYEPGKEYLQEITSQTLREEVRPVDEEYVQGLLLAGLLNIRKSDPTGYKNDKIDVDGFCKILAIDKNDYLFNVSLLIEDELVGESSIDQLTFENGGIYITAKGVKEALSKAKKDEIRKEQPAEVVGESKLIRIEHKYDVAISFAGEDRKIAESLAITLKEKGVRVFYDAFEEDQLWGKNLYEYLTKIYTEEARYCLILLSENYAKKSWTNLERQSAQARALREGKEYILPIRIDDTKIPGLPETVGYISLSNTTIEQIVDLIIKKLGKML